MVVQFNYGPIRSRVEPTQSGRILFSSRKGFYVAYRLLGDALRTKSNQEKKLIFGKTVGLTRWRLCTCGLIFLVAVYNPTIRFTS